MLTPAEVETLRTLPRGVLIRFRRYPGMSDIEFVSAEFLYCRPGDTLKARLYAVTSESPDSRSPVYLNAIVPGSLEVLEFAQDTRPTCTIPEDWYARC